jgi:hypothetical protein
MELAPEVRLYPIGGLKTRVVLLLVLVPACGGDVGSNPLTQDSNPAGGTSSAGGAPAASGTFVVTTGGSSALPCGLTEMPTATRTQPLSTCSAFGADYEVWFSGDSGVRLGPSCMYVLPAQISQGNAPTSIDVYYVQGGLGDAQVHYDRIEPCDIECAGKDGWYWDSEKRIILCPKTCASIEQDTTSFIRMVGCI